jgi:hypothetical protein
MKQHHAIFLTWSVALPSVLALVLTVVQTIASRWVWHQANLTVSDLAGRPFAWPFVAGFGIAMVTIDIYWLVRVGEVDRALLEKYFDEAEFWLRSRVAPVVRVFTLGRINPRQMVAVEVQKALVEAGRLLNSSMWWVTAQVSLRVAFGLSLWLTYALSEG